MWILRFWPGTWNPLINLPKLVGWLVLTVQIITVTYHMKKISRLKKMQNSWHMIWFSFRIPENHSMINASSRVAKSYNLHTLIFPRLSKHRRWRERGVGLGTTLYAWQWKLASLPLIMIWVMAVLHQEECLIWSSSTKSPSHHHCHNHQPR